MIRRIVLTVLLVAAAGSVQAQQRQGNPPRRQALEGRIMEQFFENYRRMAGLTPEQHAKFRTVAMRSFQMNRERQQRERDLWLQLENQMRPGVAAQPDSVSRLLDAAVALRAQQVDQLKADDREFATFLSPVQRAQLFLARERFQRNIEDLIRRGMQRQQQGAAPEDLIEP